MPRRVTNPCAPNVPGHHSYVSGEHVLRFEAIVHNTKALRCGRVLDNFPHIIARLVGMVDRFTTTLDCVDTTRRRLPHRTRGPHRSLHRSRCRRCWPGGKPQADSMYFWIFPAAG